jgi:hypothetical protein
VYAEALSTLPTDDPADGCHINSVLGNVIQPLLQACRMTGQSLPQADTAIFMLNNVSAIQVRTHLFILQVITCLLESPLARMN